MDAVQAHFQNTENAPVEETEANYPVRILRYSLIENSEGGGRHRGGLGVRRDYTFPGHEPSFSILSDKARYAPWGLFGGEAARPAKYVLNPDTPAARELPSKITFRLAPRRRGERADAGRRRDGVAARARIRSAWPPTWRRARSRWSARARCTGWSSIRARTRSTRPPPLDARARMSR